MFVCLPLSDRPTSVTMLLCIRLTADFAIIVNLVAPVAYCRLSDWMPAAAISGLTLVQAADVRNHVHSRGCIDAFIPLFLSLLHLLDIHHTFLYIYHSNNGIFIFINIRARMYKTRLTLILLL